jgi:parallel beta-helix repeat protein
MDRIPACNFAKTAGILALVAMGATWVGMAQADTELCVSDQAGFASAASKAQTQSVTIKLEQGTYHVAGTALDNTSVTFQGLGLLGGYSPNTNCASRSIDPANTTLETAPSSNFRLISNADVTIEGIGFTGYNAGFYVRWDAANLPPVINLTVRRNSITGNTGNFDMANVSWFVSGSQALNARFAENLIVNNGSPIAAACGDGTENGFGVVELDSSPPLGNGNATWTFINNTIVNNNVDGVCVNGGTLLAYNNISYGNAGPDLFVSADASASLTDNVIQSHTYQGSVTQTGTLTGNPKLDTNFRPIESPPSPVINSGYDNVPGGLPAHDLDGGQRVVGSAVDRGVYESTINDELIQTVTNTNDSGTGSLRSAIANINANGSGIVTFAIGSSCGPRVITLNSLLPGITKGGVINGYTQPGSSPNDLDVGDDATICVILEAGSGGVATGMSVPSTAGDADTLTIEGLAFSGFSSAAIDFEGGSLHSVTGNHFGGNVGGHSLQSNQVDVQLGTAVHDAIIGGDDVGDRNIIGDAHSNGIWLQGGASGLLLIGANNNQIVNNYIGVGWNPNSNTYTNRGNGSNGIRVDGHDNTFSGNLIGDNGQAGVAFNDGGAQKNVLESNFVGLTSDGTVVGNGTVGVLFEGSAGNAPENNTVRDNTIEENTREGIWVQVGHGNKLRRNSIAFNGMLGIDLAAEGVNPNDDDAGVQQEDYANHGQNYPVLTGAAGGYQSGSFSGSLTTAGGSFTVDFYASGSCDAPGHGPGHNWLGSASVTVSVPMGIDEGTASFNVRLTPDVSLTNGSAITATATNSNGDTSEFSACVTYLNDTIFANGFELPAE